MMEANAIKVRIGELCHQFRLPTMGAQSVSRFTAAGHGDALETLLEVLEQEAEDRRQRRIGRLRTASRLPAGKTWETFEFHRVPLALWRHWPRCLPADLCRPEASERALRTARHRQDPCTSAAGPTGWMESQPSAGPRPTPAGAGPARRQARPGAATTMAKARQATISC